MEWLTSVDIQNVNKITLYTTDYLKDWLVSILQHFKKNGNGLFVESGK